MKTMNCPVTKFIDSKMQRFDPLWQAQNGVGGLRSRYYDKTGVAKYREWRGLHDTMVDYRAWLKNVMSMAAMVASAPIPCLKGFWEYRWMGSYLGTFMFIDRLFEGYRGPELVIAHMNMHAIVQSLTKKIALVLSHDLRIGGKDSDKIIPVDEVMPPLFMTGFKDLIPIPLQTLPEFIICDVDQHMEPYYIDVAESFGLAADVCSPLGGDRRCHRRRFPALRQGHALHEHALQRQRGHLHVPAPSLWSAGFPVTMAMIHNEPAAHPYSTQVLRDCIEFVEKEYGVEYDWNALFKRAKHMNEQNRSSSRSGNFKTPYCPLTGISETLYRLYAWASANGQEDQFTKNDRKVIKILRKCYKNKYVPYGGTTRHRAFLWGPSAVYYTDFPTWIQNCWGINIVLNMDSTMGHNMISTTDPEQALKDLALFSEKGVMRHMAVGGWDNVLFEHLPQCRDNTAQKMVPGGLGKVHVKMISC